MRSFIVAGCAVTIVATAVWLSLSQHRASRSITRVDAHADRSPRASSPPLQPSVAPEPLPAPAEPTAPAPTPAEPTVALPLLPPPPAAVTPPTPRRAPRAAPPPPVDEPVIPLPVARVALSFVGDDPAAEEVWNEAINDPALPAENRKDLIEDLNEDGFPDPKHITPDDLPLIVSRLALIEELAPDAMDEVNAAAFDEAYKDLVNMFVRLSRQ